MQDGGLSLSLKEPNSTLHMQKEGIQTVCIPKLRFKLNFSSQTEPKHQKFLSLDYTLIIYLMFCATFRIGLITLSFISDATTVYWKIVREVGGGALAFR